MRQSILANPLPAFSLPAQSIFLNFARFSLFFNYHNAQQHTAILRRCLGVKDSKKKWRSFGAALHQQNKPKFRYYNRKFKSKCAPLLSYKELSEPRQVLQGASLKTKQTKNQKEKQALASTTRTAGFCNLHMNPGFDFQEVFLLLTNPRPLEGLREGDIETFLDIHCECSAIL